MKNYILPLFAIACCLPMIGLAQLQHFPHQENMLFQSKEQVFGATFDTATYYKDQQDSFLLIWQKGTLPPPYCDGVDLDYTQSIIGRNRFTQDSEFLYFNGHSSFEVKVPRNPKLNEEFIYQGFNTDYKFGVWKREKRTYDWGSDSVWVIQQMDDNGYMPNGYEMVIGDQMGWLKIYLRYDSLIQTGRWDQSQVIGYNLPDWHDFFPEEAGDRKQFTFYRGSWPGPQPDKGRLDEYLAVTRYPDSIVRRVKRRILDSAYRWQDPVEFDEVIKLNDSLSYPYHPHALRNLFQPDQFGVGSLSYYRTIVNSARIHRVYAAQTHFESTSNEWNVYLNIGQDRLVYDSCNSFRAEAGVPTDYVYSTRFGYKGHSWGNGGGPPQSWNLIAAEVGNHKLGTVNVGLDQLVEGHIKLYPNPTSSSWKIDGLIEATTYTYTLYDISGQSVQQGELIGAELQGDGLLPGIYYLRLQVGDTAISKKLIHH